ncbi:hypothetical protein [Streptomyces sp. bgisy126]|uniref:hypothetical protein n=1 Tax=unclassified Streptomyces TaxID=2593676 RepID=UPI003EC0B7F5
MTTYTENLVQQLDDSTGPSHDARAALIDIGPDAVPALVDALPAPVRRAYRARRERATPPDWSEPKGIRRALTELGARAPVVPPLTARLRPTAAGNGAPTWIDRTDLHPER